MNNSNSINDSTTWSYILSADTESPVTEEPAAGWNSASSYSPDPLSQEMVDLLLDIIVCHLKPILGTCGIIANVLNIVVFLMQKRSQPMNSLLMVLAVADAMFLVFTNLGVVACCMRHYDVIAARNFNIMTLPHAIWVGVTLSRISCMLTVFISLERCLVVTMPLKVKMLVTPRTVHVLTALACVIPTIAHIPVFLRGEVQWLFNARLNMTLPYLKLTKFALKNSQFLNLYKNLVLNVLFRYITMVLISVCTCVTILQLKRYSRWRLSSVTSETERSTISERDARVSVTMMRVCVLFMICSLPGCAMLTIRLIEPEFDYFGVYKRSFDLARKLDTISIVINSSSNFIIYMRAEEFRQTFCHLCQKVLPTCCFTFLFRCVMRTGQDPGKEASQGSKGLSKTTEKKKGSGSTFASATNVSNISSSVSSPQNENGTSAGNGKQ